MEHKGNVHGKEILKLSNMRRLRKRAGARSGGHLSVFECENKEQRVFDSSHFIGGKFILEYL